MFADVVKKQLSDFRESGRFKETDDNLAIFTVKERAIEVIDLLFNFRFYVRLQVRGSELPQHTLVAHSPLPLQRFIYDFRVLRGDASPPPATTPSSRGLLSTSTSSQRPPMLLHSLLTETEKQKLMQSPV